MQRRLNPAEVLLPGEDTQRHLDEQGRCTGGVISSGRDALLLHQALNQRGAGLAPAGAHAQAGDGFELVDIGVPMADERLQLAGGYPFAAAQDVSGSSCS